MTREDFHVGIKQACAQLRDKPFAEDYTCKEFAAEAYQLAGLDVSILTDAPRHSLTYGRFHSDSPLLQFIQDTPEMRDHLRPIDKDDPMEVGDLIVISDGASAHHVGVAYSDKLVYHLPRGSRVTAVSRRMLGEVNAIKAIFRIKDFA